MTASVALLLAFASAAVIVVPWLVWRWLNSIQWRPPGCDEAVAVASRALGIRPPLLYWVHGTPVVGDDGVTRYGYRDAWARFIAGMWVPHRLTIAKGDGQPYSMTALAFELAREARYQLEGVRDESESPNESAELRMLDAAAREALRNWEQKGSP